MNKYQELVQLLAKLKEIRRNTAKELSRAPKGKLQILKNHNYTTFRQIVYENEKRNEKGIGKQPKLIVSLAHKAYCLEKIRRIDRNIALIEKIIDRTEALDEASLLNALPKSFELLESSEILSGRTSSEPWMPHPVREGVFPREYPLTIDPARRFEWGCMPYLENTSFLEDKTQLSPGGTACRSKSEAGILGIYESLRIPHHRDESMFLNGRRIAPDIVGCRADGVLIYHEHLGMDGESYRKRNDWKDHVYKDAGIVRGRNLIYTFDRPDGSINLSLIKDIIKEHYQL